MNGRVRHRSIAIVQFSLSLDGSHYGRAAVRTMSGPHRNWCRPAPSHPSHALLTWILRTGVHSDGSMYTRILVPLDDTPESKAARSPARTLARALGAEIVETHVRERAAETIVSEAVNRAADLIVMASHEPTGLERLVVGSVAERVLRNSHIPVLLVHPGDR